MVQNRHAVVSTDTILLVDDDPNIRHLLRRLLERYGYTIAEAGDGFEALACIERLPAINLVITDMQMPRKTGMELLAEMRKTHAGVPVIIITAKPVVEAAVECMRNGAYDYISKPFDFDKIRSGVSRALEDYHKLARSEAEQPLFNINYRRFFGDYQILRVLGEGNAGIVFLARKNGETDPVALKVLKPNHAGKFPGGQEAERFLRSSEAISEIRHANIVSVRDFGLTRDEEIPYMVMEYIEGQTLKDFMDTLGSTLNYHDKTRILLQISMALSAIHAENICHRDVKPHNILITPNLQVKVTDFGIARLPNSELTMANELVGSPAYLSPEGFASSKVDARADIFSFGVLAYELLLGRKPFEGDSIPQFAHKIRTEPPREPRKIATDFPEGLQQVLARMLRKRPEERYATVNELANDLRNYLGGDATVTDTTKCTRDSIADWC